MPGERPLAGQADDVFGADVRGEDGGPDHHPAGVPPGQEVIVGVLLMAAIPPGDKADDGEVECNDDPVECVHYFMVPWLAEVLGLVVTGASGRLPVIGRWSMLAMIVFFKHISFQRSMRRERLIAWQMPSRPRLPRQPHCERKLADSDPT